MKVEFDVTVDEKDLIDYKIYHKYHAFSGWCEIILGIILLLLGAYALMNQETMNLTFALLALLFAVVFLIVIPVQLVLNAKKAIRGEAFAKPMHYVIDEENITVSMGEDTAGVSWDMVYRVKDTGKSILVYFTPTRANIIPKRELGEQLEAVKNVMTAGAGKYKVSFKN
ncbi:MAG: YcxB family protein [Bacteroides sp.]|nr:YcxB family protein [Clostridia bacterium]